jgi:hypothetical protein
MSCPDVASCLGITNDNGIISCELKTKLDDIEDNTSKLSKEFKCWRRSSLSGVRLWLLILSLLFVFLLFLILYMCYKLGCVSEHVRHIEQKLMIHISPSLPPPSLPPPQSFQPPQQPVVYYMPPQPQQQILAPPSTPPPAFSAEGSPQPTTPLQNPAPANKGGFYRDGGGFAKPRRRESYF